MENLSKIADQIRQSFDARTLAREQALMQARKLTQHSAYAIRAIHRGEEQQAQKHLIDAGKLTADLKLKLAEFPDLYFAGYTQDAIKEYVEASITRALIESKSLPTPDELDVEHAAYIKGLAETVGELRRRCLDILRKGYSEEAERLLSCMDEIYALLVTLDYPDAVTHGLRRQTDLVRGILERTRGDLTTSLRENKLLQAMEDLNNRLPPVD
jgi:translin